MSENEKPEVTVEEDGKKTFTEELEVAGSQLVDRVQELIKQGNVRRIIVRSADDKVLVETSLTIAAAAGGVLILTPAGWILAALGAIAAAVARVKIEIVREISDDNEVVEAKKKVEIKGE